MSQSAGRAARRAAAAAMPRAAVRRPTPRLTGLILGSMLAALPAVAQPDEADAVSGAYREVLDTLAAAGLEPALERLVELETRTLGEFPPPRRLERFWRLKLGVIRDVLQTQAVDVLVPVIVLHHDAQRRYLERGAGGLAAHSRQMATELAEIYSQRDRSPAARAFSAWVFTSFGSQLQEYRSLRRSANLFQQALELDPANRVALLSLAAGFEKVAQYGKAIEHLERALALDPDDPQVRLRLALCRLRKGEAGGAEVVAELAALAAASDHAAWIRSVAFQELSRIERAAGELDRAEAALRRGLAVLPQDQPLLLQLALLLDAQQRRSEARELLARLSASPPRGPTSRLTYDSWPRADMREGLDTLHEMMESRRPALASGLQPPSEPVANSR